MKIASFITSLRSLFKRWFHKRNIIIISERKVKHVPISGALQFIIVLTLSTGICWASYSTGSFIAARSALKEQGQALRSVTNAHIEDNFAAIYPHPLTNTLTSKTSAAAMASLDNTQLVARITLLENKVVELKETNQAIVQSVQAKAAGNIDDLENIIKKTGLNVSQLKKDYSERTKHDRKAQAQGGPYIPDEQIATSPEAKEMFTNLDDLAMLSIIVKNLPLATHIINAEEESPGASKQLFGMSIAPWSKSLQDRYNLESKSGVIITQTAPDSPADRAGLRAGDLILKVDGRKVDGVETLRKAAKGKNRLLVWIERAGEYYFVTLRN